MSRVVPQTDLDEVASVYNKIKMDDKMQVWILNLCNPQK